MTPDYRRRILGTTFAAILALGSQARAEIIGIETFEYRDGLIDGDQGGFFWDFKNTVPAAHTGSLSDWDSTDGAAVLAGRLITSGNSADREYNGPGEGFPPSDEAQGAVNDFNVNRAIYHSVTCTTGATLPASFGITSLDFVSPRIVFGKRPGQANFGLEDILTLNSDDSGPAITPNTTYTLVTKIDFANDEIALFVDPDFSGSEPTPSVSLPYTGTNWSTAVRFSSSAGADPIIWDNLLVATSWEDLGLVNTTEDEDDGSLDRNAGSGTSLREAIKYSPAGRFISFAPSLSGKTIQLSSEIVIDKPVAALALSLPAGVTISGGGSNRLFEITAQGDLSLANLTIADGNSGTSNGGGISNQGSLLLFACTIRDCAASSGGAIANGGSVTINRCTISGNHASDTGGVAFQSGGTITISDSTASGNTSSNVGGIRFDAGSVDLSGTILSGNGSSNISPSASSTENSTTSGDPQLAPLGHYGGPTQTMHPLAGSPVIDAGVTTTRADQRGFALSGPRTIGAVKVRTVTEVTDVASLRTALANSAQTQGRVITFDPSVFTDAGITLGNTGQLIVPGTADGLFIDASSIQGGVTIDAGGNSRILEIQPGATAAFHGLTLTGGAASGSSFNENSGGAIYNDRATLSLSACTLSDNSAASGGGGIYNAGLEGSATLSLSACTLSGNSASSGGGILSEGGGGIASSSATVDLRSCTLSGNSAGKRGGGIFISNRDSGGSTALSLKSCTLSSNQADTGGGVFSGGGGTDNTVSLSNTILAGNIASFATSEPDLDAVGITVNSSGTNLIDNDLGDNLIGGDPKLAPLGNYGGPTHTMHPLAGSPAIDAGTVTAPRISDQRGLPRIAGAAIDIGAVELGPITLVTTASDENGPDLSGDVSLREAIDHLPENSVIHFDPDVFDGDPTDTITLTTGAQLTIRKSLTIDATNISGGVTIDGGGNGDFNADPGETRCFFLPQSFFEISPTVAFHSLTIQNGTHNGETGGGNILNNVNLTLHRCQILDGRVINDDGFAGGGRR